MLDLLQLGVEKRGFVGEGDEGGVLGLEGRGDRCGRNMCQMLGCLGGGGGGRGQTLRGLVCVVCGEGEFALDLLIQKLDTL